MLENHFNARKPFQWDFLETRKLRLIYKRYYINIDAKFQQICFGIYHIYGQEEYIDRFIYSRKQENNYTNTEYKM